MKVFLLVWFGQLVSAIGSRLTGFAMGVWMYQQTGSVTQYALIYLFTYLPETLMSPIAEALVDRWDRRTARIVSDAGAAVCTLAIAFLLFNNYLHPWNLYPILAIKSGFTAFQIPAYTAATSLLVSKEHYSRTGGMIQLAQAASQVAASMLAGFLVGVIQVQGVFVIDFCTFLVANLTLLAVKFLQPEVSVAEKSSKGSLWQEMVAGWHYITQRPGMLGLLIFLLMPFFTLGMLEALFTPLILSFATVAQLGTVLTVGGCGWLLGSVCITSWGGPKKRIYGVFGFVIMQGCCLFLSGLQHSVTLAAIGCFGYLFAYPIILSCNQAIWQSKVLPDLQSRVFGVRRLIEQLPPGIAYIIAGPLVDRCFEPWLSANGLLADSVGKILGVGIGRGISFLFIIIGTLNILANILTCQYPQIRLIEKTLPDAIGGKPII